MDYLARGRRSKWARQFKKNQGTYGELAFVRQTATGELEVFVLETKATRLHCRYSPWTLPGGQFYTPPLEPSGKRARGKQFFAVVNARVAEFGSEWNGNGPMIPDQTKPSFRTALAEFPHRPMASYTLNQSTNSRRPRYIVDVFVSAVPFELGEELVKDVAALVAAGPDSCHPDLISARWISFDDVAILSEYEADCRALI